MVITMAIFLNKENPSGLRTDAIYPPEQAKREYWNDCGKLDPPPPRGLGRAGAGRRSGSTAGVSGALHLGQTFTASHSRYRIVTVARKPPRGETALTSVKVV